MASQQAELQDPEIRAALDRRVREEGETVVKGGTGGTSLEAQERLAEGTTRAHVAIAGRKKGGRSRTAESDKERAEKEGGVLIEPDEKQLQETMKDIGRN